MLLCSGEGLGCANDFLSFPCSSQASRAGSVLSPGEPQISRMVAGVLGESGSALSNGKYGCGVMGALLEHEDG